MTRVYVSGPMTGIEDLNRPAFHAAATDLRSQGFQVINPAECHINDGTWADYMRMDLTMMLDDCDTIYVLPGWQKSKEARLEVAIAHQLGMPVLAYPEGIHLVEDIRVHTNHDEFTAALKRTSPTTEQATAALQKFINGTHSLNVPPMLDDPDMIIGRVIDERDELKAENLRLSKTRNTILKCAEAIEFYMGGPWNCDGPSSVGKAFHIHECIRDIRKALQPNETTSP